MLYEYKQVMYIRMSPPLTQQGRDSNFGSGRVQRQQNINKYTSIGVNRIAVLMNSSAHAQPGSAGKLKTSEVPRVNEMWCSMRYKIMR